MTLRGSVLGGYDSASAPLEPEEDARLSTLPFSPPHNGSSDSATFDPPHTFSLHLSLSPSPRRIYGSLAVSVDRVLRRFHPCLSFPDFSNYPPAPALPFSSPAGNFSVSAARTVRRLPRFRTRLLHPPLPPLARICFYHFILFLPFHPARNCPYLFTSI